MKLEIKSNWDTCTNEKGDTIDIFTLMMSKDGRSYHISFEESCFSFSKTTLIILKYMVGELVKVMHPELKDGIHLHTDHEFNKAMEKTRIKSSCHL